MHNSCCNNYTFHVIEFRLTQNALVKIAYNPCIYAAYLVWFSRTDCLVLDFALNIIISFKKTRARNMNLDLVISILTMHISGYMFRVIDLSGGYD